MTKRCRDTIIQCTKHDKTNFSEEETLSYWCGKNMKNTYMKYKNRYDDSDIVLTFIESLVNKKIGHSYNDFIDHVREFENDFQRNILRDIHISYVRGVMDHMHADRFLWFLTCREYPPSSAGPSLMVQYYTNKEFKQAWDLFDGKQRLIRLLMDIPYDRENHGVATTFIDRWSKTEVVFANQFHFPLPKGMLQEGLEKVTFGEEFHQTLQPVDLPASVKELTLLSAMDILLYDIRLSNHSLPYQLTILEAPATTLVMGSPNVLPQTLKKLIVRTFEGDIVLPTGLQELTVIDRHPCLNERLPADLKKLVLIEQNNIYILPDGLQELTLHRFNQPFIMLPKGLKKLVLHDYDRQILLPTELEELELHRFDLLLLALLPEGLKILVLRDYNHYIRLPNGLKELELHRFDQSSLVLPKELEKLILIDYSDHIHLPNGLKELELHSFNRSSLVLPQGLEKLMLYDYRHPIILHNRLKELKLHSFNQSSLVLPQGLEKLTLYDYRHPIILHNGLKELELHSFNQSSLVLPQGLEKLTLYDYRHPIILHNGLKELELHSFNQPSLVLPQGLEKIVLYDYNYNIFLPKGVKELELHRFDQSSLVLPEGLEKIVLYDYNYNIFLPKGLKELELHVFDQSSLVLPEGLEKLILYEYNYPILLPEGLTELELYRFDQLSLVLPKGLERLTLHVYNHPIIDPLPDGLYILELYQFNQPLNFSFPERMERLLLNSFEYLAHPLPSGLKIAYINQVSVIGDWVPDEDVLVSVSYTITKMLARHGYAVVEKLGQGSFGTTYLASDKDENLLAIKVIERRSNDYHTDDVKEEIDALEVLTKYHSMYMAQYKGSFSDGRFECIVLEYIKGTTLDDKILTLSDPTERRTIMKQLLFGLQHIHHSGYAHMDIKPTNIMFDDLTQHIKFIDFGLSCFRDRCMSNNAGTAWYTPPESFINPSIGGMDIAKAHDIWSLAMVFAELCQGFLPYEFPLLIIDYPTYFHTHTPKPVQCETDVHVARFVNALIVIDVEQRCTIDTTIKDFNDLPPYFEI